MRCGTLLVGVVNGSLRSALDRHLLTGNRADLMAAGATTPIANLALDYDRSHDVAASDRPYVG